ncbi:hypothetical protein FQN52_005854 [Onygenales sp. PD_12]|nr:hypothetical protein FQN52_005854 [Onygenales sp. PD_12]
MHQQQADHSQSALLFQLLVDLYLWVFQKDVFNILSSRAKKDALDPAHLDATCHGDILLMRNDIHKVFQNSPFKSDLNLVTEHNMKVSSIEALFMLL